MIEVDVHQQLHAFLRAQGEVRWPHHLTIARLVARALRLQRSALIQVSAAAKYQGQYRLSYLVPLMLCEQPVILVAPEVVQQRLLQTEIPQLSEWMHLQKPIHAADHWPSANFSGLLLLSPQVWLQDYLQQHHRFPSGIPTLIDGADELETWVCQQLQISLSPQDWERLMWSYPHQSHIIRDAKVKLTRAIFQHTVNPYACSLMGPPEHQILMNLRQALSADDHSLSPVVWQQFWQWSPLETCLSWAEVKRQQGSFTLHCAPLELYERLQPLWSRQAVVLMGGNLDPDPQAVFYRQQVGLGDLTCVQFSAERQTEAIQLYIPDGLPLPNTPEFQTALMQEIHQLMAVTLPQHPSIVVIIDDFLPLKTQVAARLAAEFGSRVKVETSDLNPNSVLVTGWSFWQQTQQLMPPPQLLVIATLPIPSLEDPRVAGQVAYYKRRRLDWFRCYLLPTALRTLQGAIAPIREQRGTVVLLDNRILHRSYGPQVLAALSPYARLNHIDDSLWGTGNDEFLNLSNRTHDEYDL